LILNTCVKIRICRRYLCLRNIKDAKISFDTFVSEISSKRDIKTGVAQYQETITGEPFEIPIYSLPLLNFLHLLILTVQRDAADLFVQLRIKYRNTLLVEQSDNVSLLFVES